MACVYAIAWPGNSKLYVGFTTKTIEDRWERHLKGAEGGLNRAISRAIRKYGAQNAVILTLSQGIMAEEAIAQEIWWIKELGTQVPNGYNLTTGGEGTPGLKRKSHSPWNKGKFASPETVVKLSLSHSGQVPWNLNKRHTSGSLLRMSIAHIGKRHSEETREKMRGPRGPSFKGIEAQRLRRKREKEGRP